MIYATNMISNGGTTNYMCNLVILVVDRTYAVYTWL